MDVLGTRLKELREEKELSQEGLAELIGKSKNSIYNYENGKRLPDADVLCKLAGFFGESVDYLLGIKAPTQELADMLNSEAPPARRQLLEIFELIQDMHNALRGAEMEVAKAFLSELFKILKCIDECCEDAVIIAEGIYHMAYDNLSPDMFDAYAGDLLDLSSGMKRVATSRASKLIDDIRLEATGKLADYYGIEPVLNKESRKLDVLKGQIEREVTAIMKKKIMQYRGDSDGNHKETNE